MKKVNKQNQVNGGRMKTKKEKRKKNFGAAEYLVLCMAVLVTLPAAAAPTNVLSGGDFEGFTMGSMSPMGQTGNLWMVSSDSAGQTFGISSYDIDGAGGLDISNVFVASVGSGSGGSITISQMVSLAAGVSYSFAGQIASAAPASNADGGTVTTSISSTELDSYSFGTVLFNSPEYAGLSGTFVPVTSGDYLLSIEIGRLYQTSSISPWVYLDNVEFSYENAAVVPAPDALILSGLGLLVLQWMGFGRTRKQTLN